MKISTLNADEIREGINVIPVRALTLCFLSVISSRISSVLLRWLSTLHVMLLLLTLNFFSFYRRCHCQSRHPLKVDLRRQQQLERTGLKTKDEMCIITLGNALFVRAVVARRLNLIQSKVDERQWQGRKKIKILLVKGVFLVSVCDPTGIRPQNRVWGRQSRYYNSGRFSATNVWKWCTAFSIVGENRPLL